MMSRTQAEQRNLDLVMDMFAAVLQPMDSASVDRFMADDYIQHSPMAAPGRAGLKDFLDHIRRETPLGVHDIKRAFVDGDHVTVHTHVRRWPGDLGLAVIDLYRIDGARIAEHWDVVQPVPADGPNPRPMF
jgi:predicted SnoaL-like aldol condensation-catalyzing enzyme